MAGRNAQKEQARIKATVRAYLARAAVDRSLSLTYEGIQAETGVSRTHFAKPDYVDIAAEILEANTARIATPSRVEALAAGAPASASVAPEPESLADLTDHDLAVRIRFYSSEADRLMRTWLGHHKSFDAHRAPLLLHDLDSVVGQLFRQADELRPLIAERQRRADLVTRDLPPDPGAEQPSLF